MLWSLALALALLSSLLKPSVGALKVGFYTKSCLPAESIVSSVVRQASLSDPTIPAALLRLHYHDCFVQGCDGSVLIQSPTVRSPENSSPSHAGLRGFEVIDRAKSRLEAKCRGVVSCADIVALAARDSIVVSQGPFYQVPTGRRDGRVSNASDASDMPDVRDPLSVLKAKFAKKGLSEKDLVFLTAAHTIGTTACFFLKYRLYNFLPGGRPDPLINAKFLPELRSRCPRDGSDDARLALDRESERRFDDGILRNIESGFAAIESDAKLYTDASTRRIVDSCIGPGSSGDGAGLFRAGFVRSMVKMGKVGVKTGPSGEVRRVCSRFN